MNDINIDEVIYDYKRAVNDYYNKIERARDELRRDREVCEVLIIEYFNLDWEEDDVNIYVDSITFHVDPHRKDYILDKLRDGMEGAIVKHEMVGGKLYVELEWDIREGKTI